MSLSDRPPSETTSLLADSQPAGQSNGSPPRKNVKYSSATLLIPVALAMTLANGVPSTTIIELMRTAVCKLWNASHGDPAMVMVAGDINVPDRCDAPEIAQYFAVVLAMLGAIRGIISIIGCGLFSRISSRYGRKPAFLMVLTAGITSCCTIALSQQMPGRFSNWVLFVGILFGVFSSPISYLFNMYIVDGCAPEDRTVALSKIAGWSGLGTCISFALGGSITTRTGDPVIVFYMATVMYVATFIYVATVLPESFSEEKRSALLRMRPEPTITGFPAAARFVVFHIFEPLKLLIPARRLDGTRNWRLLWCAVHNFLFMVAHSYASDAWLVLATSKYHLTPADTGIFLTIIFISGTIFLVLVVPPLIRFLRPYYRREIARSLLAEENLMNSDVMESQTSDHLHVHLAAVACVIGALAFFSAAVFIASQALILSGICIGISFIHSPTVRSLVVGSVDPLEQGEALAAIEMVSNAGSFLSPVIMGSIFTATIGTQPLLVFYVQLAVVLISSALLFLVRDADRYWKPHDA